MSWPEVGVEGPPFFFINLFYKNSRLKSIELLYYLMLCNGLLTCLFVIMGKKFTMTYTNIIVTRKVGAYLLTIVMLSLIGLFTSGKYKFVEIILYLVNVIILFFLVFYFGSMLRRKL
jgi:hypothetical protein